MKMSRQRFTLSIGALLATSSRVGLAAEQAFCQDVAWSPDSDQLLFSRSVGNDGLQLFSITSDGRDLRPLTNDPKVNNVFGCWSPDGRRIAFRSDRSGERHIYLMDADGTNQVQLTVSGAPNSFPSWSPDGKRLAFNSQRTGKWQVYTSLVDGTDVRRVTNDDSDNENPAYAPKSNAIVFESNRDTHAPGTDQIYVILDDGSAERRVTRDTQAHVFPSWRGDGTVIFSSTDVNHKTSIAGVELSSGSTESYPLKPGFFARWSPDDKAVAIIAGAYPNSNIYVSSTDGNQILTLI